MPTAEEMAQGEDGVEEAVDAVQEAQESLDAGDDDFDFDATDDSFFDKLWADSPDKELHEYNNHPLNFRGTDGNARICRAIEGFGLDASKAIIDAIIGIAQEMNELNTGGD